MKKFTLLLALMAIVPALLASAVSDLTITINENADFYAVLDGRQYDSHSGSVVISDVRQGNHSLEVFKHNMTLDGFTTDRIYAGRVDILPNKSICATIDRSGSFVVLSSVNLFGNNDYGYNNGYGNDYGYDNDHGNGHDNGHGNGYGNGHGNGYYGGGYNSGYYGSGSYGTGNYYSFGMAPETFSMLVLSVRREPFDESKVRLASTAIAMNGITSAQLRELMFLITFDSNRLKLAELAYASVIDKNNIFLINDAFTFRSNSDEFYHFIGAW